MAVTRPSRRPKRLERPGRSKRELKPKEVIPLLSDPKTTRTILDIFVAITDLVREQRAELRSKKLEDAKSLLIVQLFRMNPELKVFLDRLEAENRESYADLIDAIKVRINEELSKL